MSCEQTTKAYEACHERFWELMEDYDFQAAIYVNFLSPQDQWKEKEIGFNEDPYDNFFDYMWKYDPELAYRDVKGAVARYLEKLSMERWLANGGTSD